MKSGLELDLGNMVIQMIDTLNKTLEDMLKTYSTCKKTRHKMEEAQTKTCEETELAGAAQQHRTYPVCSGRSTRHMCALGSGCSVPPDMSGVTPDTPPDRVPERLQLELEKAIRHRTYQVCTEHEQFSNGRQQLVQQLAEGRPPHLYGVWPTEC